MNLQVAMEANGGSYKCGCPRRFFNREQQLLVEAVDAESKNLDLVSDDFCKFDDSLDQVVEDFEQVCEHFGPDDYVKAESGLGKTGRWSHKDSETAD